MTCVQSEGPDIRVPYGNDKTWAIRATNPDGTDKDMTGYTLVFTVAQDSQHDNDPEYVIQKTATLDTPTAPVKGHLVLTAAELTELPGKYKYDKALWKSGLKQSSQIGSFYIDEVINTESAP